MRNLFKRKSISFSALILSFAATPLMAAKPMDAIELSNGYPIATTEYIGL
ncbi:hypothetical protein [Desulfopila aestuarii]|uniref:Uncharacterized protein n=1 Tax=Desulfopila aestuarii DSM 18488 TaxID=1121416 RepID=A0A1M7YM08_9BACT|nr:hypothetical protein [Desulfopila aestuarii]SHO53661.1 hypothetical protein SAMN02745220_05248 [Desulfopila aestuarii DSM 18488]